MADFVKMGNHTDSRADRAGKFVNKIMAELGLADESQALYTGAAAHTKSGKPMRVLDTTKGGVNVIIQPGVQLTTI
ncbi:MAG: hypothetical protein NTW79_01815 [Candidatus Berkelbacteria bacterium]|nr:hypothetical protein [Candidatus Berkelbacteria bacterium]